MYTNLAQTIKFKSGRNTDLHVATDGVVLKHPTIKLVDLCPVVRPVGFFFVCFSLFFVTSFSLNSPVQLHPDGVYPERLYSDGVYPGRINPDRAHL